MKQYDKSSIRSTSETVIGPITLLMVVLLIIRNGYGMFTGPKGDLVFSIAASLFLINTILDGVFRFVTLRSQPVIPGTNRLTAFIPDLVFFLSALSFIFLPLDILSVFMLLIVRNALRILQQMASTTWFEKFGTIFRRNPSRIILASFASTILIGTLYLTFPVASSTGRPVPFITALFTSVSATCVTGLIVVDTPTFFSRAGQTAILILIQAGGLGIMTFSASLVYFLRKRMSLKEMRLAQTVLGQEDVREMRDLIIDIFTMTAVFEILGAVLMYPVFLRSAPSAGDAAFTAVFQSVSAFCNAGFSLFSDSLEGYRDNGIILGVTGALVVAGGLGFSVVSAIMGWSVAGRKKGTGRFDAQTRIVLYTTATLITVGTIVFFLFERNGTLAGMSFRETVYSSIFQSITTRTAGFNSIRISTLGPATLLVMMVLMFIGASPGSTGGGVKTSTFFLLVVAVRAMMRGQDEVKVLGRTVPQRIIFKAAVIVILSMSFITLGIIALLAVEEQDHLGLMFEAVSAFGTVGLSTGITPGLTTLGKLVIIILMFAGRVGPLTTAFAVGEAAKPAPFHYPEGRFAVG